MYKVIGADGVEYGPVTVETLRQWISDGRVNAQTRIQLQGTEGWKAASEFYEIAVFLPKSPSGPPPLSSGNPATPPSFGSAGSGGAIPGSYNSYPRQTALDKVNAPSICLMVVGGLGILESISKMLFANTLMLELSKNPALTPEMAQAFTTMAGNRQVVVPVLGILLNGLIIFGAIKMRKLTDFGLCMLSAILAVIPCCSPCCCIGIPFGIWALVVLNQPEVRSQIS